MSARSIPNPPLHGGSFGKQTGLRGVAGFVISETRHQSGAAAPSRPITLMPYKSRTPYKTASPLRAYILRVHVGRL